MADSIAILNSIRSEGGTEYTERIPLATRENITTVGNAVLSYSATKETFLNTLVNRIALVLVKQMQFENKLAIFKKGEIPFGETIENIFIELSKGENFNGSDTNPFAINKGSVKTEFYSKDRELVYTKTITDVQLKSAFLSSTALNNFVSSLTMSIYQSVEFDEFIMTKELLGASCTTTPVSMADSSTGEGSQNVLVSPITDESTAKAFYFTVKKLLTNFEFPRTIYNKNGVLNTCKLANTVLLINKDVKNTLDTYLTGVYNLDLILPKVNIIVVDDFGTRANRYAQLIDSTGVNLYGNLSDSESQRNKKAKYTNIFVHKWYTYGISNFSNNVSIEITPEI